MDVKYEYAGFWVRFWAVAVDSVLILLVTMPILNFLYGDEVNTSLFLGFWDVFLNLFFPIFATIVFWYYRSGTPGKMLFKLSIVDDQTGGKPTMKQFLVRYFSYIISILPVFLGFFWIAFDSRKQGFHDKIAYTVVLRKMNIPEFPKKQHLDF